MKTILTHARLILRNDLRLLWRDVRTGKSRLFTGAAMLGVILLVLHAVALLLFFQFDRFPPLNVEAGIWAFFGFLMLGASMNHAISLFFERADFDLLLSSPVSPRAVLLARLLTMATGAFLGAAMFLLPILNGISIGFSRKYLFGYIVWAELAVLVSSLGACLTLALVGWLGPRRARVWVQLVAAFLGGVVFLAFQAQNFLPMDARMSFLRAIARSIDLLRLERVAAAGRGDPLSLLWLTLAAGLAVGITTRQLARTFLGGLQESSSQPARRKTSTSTYRFASSVHLVTFKKDVRLILRDPLLLSQILPSVIYIIPAFFGLGRFGGITVLAPITVVVAVQFSTLLAHVAASGEECLDLIRMSPSQEVRLRIAKLAAGMAIPVSLSVILCVVMAALGRPWLALLTFAVAAYTAAGCGWLEVSLVSPTPRKDIMRRRSRKGSLVRSVVIGALLISACAGISMIAHGAWWLVGTVLLGANALGVLGCFVLVNPTAIEGDSPSSEWKPAPATTS